MNGIRGWCLSWWKADCKEGCLSLEEGSGSYHEEQALLAPAALCI